MILSKCPIKLREMEGEGREVQNQIDKESNINICTSHYGGPA